MTYATGEPKVWVFEHLNKPLFWILAIFLPLFTKATVSSAVESKNHRFHPSSRTSQSIPLVSLTAWIHPFLKTRRHITITTVIYLGILYLQVKEASWLFQTEWRFTRSFWQDIPPLGSMNFILYCFLLSSFLLVVGFGAASIGGVVFMVSGQLFALIELGRQFWDFGQNIQEAAFDEIAEEKSLSSMNEKTRLGGEVETKARVTTG